MIASHLNAWFHNWLEGWRTCRACSARARVWDDICPHCGAAHPVHVSGFQAVLATTIAAETILLLLR